MSSHSIRQAVNEQELYSSLRSATEGYGNLARFATRMGVTRRYIEGMLHGSRRISVAVAAALGWELRWVRKADK